MPVREGRPGERHGGRRAPPRVPASHRAVSQIRMRLEGPPEGARRSGQQQRQDSYARSRVLVLRVSQRRAHFKVALIQSFSSCDHSNSGCTFLGTQGEVEQHSGKYCGPLHARIQELEELVRTLRRRSDGVSVHWYDAVEEGS
jgi:hypothetical protein